MILLKSVCLEDSRPFLLCITHSLVHRQRLHLLLYWPDNGDFVWFVESDVVTWRHHLGIISDWLFQGFLSLHCNWLDGTLTSILLIGLKLDISFERFNWALSKPCLVDHCLSQGFSSLSILSRMQWLFPYFFSHDPDLFLLIFSLLFSHGCKY